jgi:hypothetical protein
MGFDALRGVLQYRSDAKHAAALSRPATNMCASAGDDE